MIVFRASVPLSMVLFSVALLVPLSLAWAQTSAAPARPSSPMVDALQRAAAARKAGRWAEAAEAYRAAWALDARPELAGELGTCELALGQHRDAAEHLHLALHAPHGLPPQQRGRFEAALEQAERHLATVAIAANPPRAEVLVDGRSLGAPRATYVVFLDPGRHRFRARLAGHRGAALSLDLRPGTTPEVSLRLFEIAPPPPPPPNPPAPCSAGAPCGSSVAGALRVVGFGIAGTALVAGAAFAGGAAWLDAEAGRYAEALPPGACHDRRTAPYCRDLTRILNTRDALAGAAVLAFITSGGFALVTVSSYWWAPAAAPGRAVVSMGGTW